MASPAGTGWTCPRCDSRLPPTATECDGCGMPTVFMEPPAADELPIAGSAVEPEVLESLAEAERTRFGPQARQVGCTLGPGCGCVGLPLLALAGVAGLLVSLVVALLSALSLGRAPASLAQLAARLRRGFHRF